jgi:hypothetical protein
MPQNYGFRWREGRGWLILIGPTDPHGEMQSDIRAHILSIASADGPLAALDVGGSIDAADRVLEDFEDLGAPSGFIVDPATDDDDTLRARLAEAGIIVLTGEPDGAAAFALLNGPAIEGIAAAHDSGAIVAAELGAAAAFGAFLVEWAIGRQTAAFAWLENALVTTTSTTNGEVVRAWLMETRDLRAVGLGDDSAIAFGPDGEVELWGAKQIKVILGPA